MIQRKQTLFILVAVLCGIVCLCLPIARWIPESMGDDTVVYNLFVKNGEGDVSYSVAGLFFLQLISLPIGIFAIFKYTQRKLQMNLCMLNLCLLLVWYLLFALAVNKNGGVGFQPKLAACLPMIEVILYFLARKSIWADEKLIRSADRIR